MTRTTQKRWLLAGLSFALISTTLSAAEWSGNIALEARHFPHDALDSRQHDDNLSLSVQPEFYHQWDGGNQSFTFVPFARIDQGDDERSHADIRELTWLMAADNWELRVGIRKLFWGVTESQHLVDIINQTDGVENLDGEDKLGQPMINGAWITEHGTFDLFILPRFRERTFAGTEGRLRTIPRVDDDLTSYESSDEESHIDSAIRWSHILGELDVALSHFSGTSRDPIFTPTLNSQGELVLAPHYALIDQTGIELQTTIGDWLWKLEAIHRSAQGESYNASVAGFEYTLVGLFDSPFDLGLIAEYHYDNRGESATTPFEDDLFIGSRLTLNDAQSSEILAGVIVDLDEQSRFYTIEASRRLGEQFKLTLEARWFSNMESSDPLFTLRSDDYLLMELVWYF